MHKWLGLAALVTLLDQISKWAILASLPLYTRIEITGFFNLVHVRNEGAAFSLLADQPGWQRLFFIALSLTVSGFIVWWLRKPAPTRQHTAFALILGGALGNVIDRIIHGNVVDFLDFHLLGWHWPAFNVADSAIVLAAGILIWISFRPPHDSNPP